MKVVCGGCQAKYQVPDERVMGRKLKIRCRVCAASIIVRGDTGAQPGMEPEPQYPAESARLEWYTSVDGQEHGPLDEATLVSWLLEHDAWDAHVWREGLGDWQLARDVPGLVEAAHLLAATGEAAQGGLAPEPMAAESFVPEPQAASVAPVAPVSESRASVQAATGTDGTGDEDEPTRLLQLDRGMMMPTSGASAGAPSPAGRRAVQGQVRGQAGGAYGAAAYGHAAAPSAAMQMPGELDDPLLQPVDEAPMAAPQAAAAQGFQDSSAYAMDSWGSSARPDPTLGGGYGSKGSEATFFPEGQSTYMPPGGNGAYGYSDTGLTGMRNEESVLFSASDLRRTAASHHQVSAAPLPAGGYWEGPEAGSGLIDIRAMASAAEYQAAADAADVAEAHAQQQGYAQQVSEAAPPSVPEPAPAAPLDTPQEARAETKEEVDDATRTFGRDLMDKVPVPRVGLPGFVEREPTQLANIQAASGLLPGAKSSKGGLGAVDSLSPQTTPSGQGAAQRSWVPVAIVGASAVLGLVILVASYVLEAEQDTGELPVVSTLETTENFVQDGSGEGLDGEGSGATATASPVTATGEEAERRRAELGKLVEEAERREAAADEVRSGAVLASAAVGPGNDRPAPPDTTNVALALEPVSQQPARDEVLRSLRAITPQVEKCGRVHGASGTAQVKLSVHGKDGQVSDASVEGIEGEAAACVVDVVKTASFPPFRQDRFKITFPFRL